MKSDLDDLPSYESNRHVRLHYKRNEDVSLSRINRWLMSKVGQKFESVFSEWTKLSWLPSRLRDSENFKYHVETEFAVDEKEELCAYSYGWMRPLSDEFYIDPDSHLLLYAKKLKRVSYKEKMKAERDKVYRSLGDYTQLCKIDGIWYFIELNTSFKIRFYDYINKTFQTKTVNVEKGKCYFDISCWDLRNVVKRKEQLDSKTLKKYNLKND